MAPKRTLELAATDSDHDDEHSLSIDDREPPAKRRMTSIPHTPLPTRHFSKPQTPFTGTPYPSRPLDSPSNPVGRKRTQALVHSLPAPSSFSKHLPLRFQFVRPGVSPRMGGIYRVVQVPLSYTFVQLRCLIAFLFGGGYGDEREDRHLFEVKKKIVLYAQTYKPCQIRSGYTSNRLSTSRDPCRYRPEVDEDALWDDDATTRKPEDDTENIAEEDTDEGEGGEDDPGWTWEAEEEFTIGHTWSRGGDVSRAIIYHHNETAAVHITLNTGSLPRRAGVSNAPYVFSARGRVRLFPHSTLPLPKPLFSVPVSKLSVPSFRPSAWSTSSVAEDTEDADGESDPEYGDASSRGFLANGIEEEDLNSDDAQDDQEDIDEVEEEDPNVMLSIDKFNASNAFATYLRFVHQHSGRCQYPGSDSSESDDDEPYLLGRPSETGSTPGLIHSSSSPFSSSPIASSSVGYASSPFIATSNRFEFNLHDLYAASLSTLSTLSTTAFTPAPPHAPWQRRRLERVQKRMEKYKKRQWMSSVNDDDEEVDQLCEEAKKEEKKSFPSWRHKDKKKKHIETDPAKLPPLWVKPILKPGEIWDPFGDELEV